MMRYRMSRWCKIFTNGDVVALYHSLSLAIVFMPKIKSESLISTLKRPQQLSVIISRIGKSAVDVLLSERIIVSDDNNDLELLHGLRDKLVQDTTLEFMYLLLTDSCNLRCDYCFEETPVAANFKPVLMNRETAKKSIDYFDRLVDKYGNPNRKKIINLYGGEPFLNKRIVKYAVSYISELNKKHGFERYEIVVVTNGTLIDEDMVCFLVRNQVSIGLSLDGPQDINGTHRKSNGKKSFQKIMNAHRLLKMHGAKFGISATLTPVVIDNFDRVLDFFIKDLGIKDGISFNILHYNPSIPVGFEYFEKAAKCLIKAFERFRTLGIYEERVMRKAESFVGRKAMFADCGVVGNQIVIAPDGKIGVCQDFVKPRTYFDGSVFDGDYDPFERGLFDGWRKRSPLFMDQCIDCNAVAICGGGCPASVELKTGNRWNVDERICQHSKLTLEWLIWETFHKISTGA